MANFEMPAQFATLEVPNHYDMIGLKGINKVLFDFWSGIGITTLWGRVLTTSILVGGILWLIKPRLMFDEYGNMRPLKGLSRNPDATFFYFPFIVLLLGFAIGIFP